MSYEEAVEGAARKSMERSRFNVMLVSGSTMVGSLARRIRALARRRDSWTPRRLCLATSRSSVLKASKTELGST